MDVFRRKNTDAAADVQGFADTLSRNIERLSKLVDDLLFLSRDDQTEKHEVSLRDICDEVFLDLEERAELKGWK